MKFSVLLIAILANVCNAQEFFLRGDHLSEEGGWPAETSPSLTEEGDWSDEVFMQGDRELGEGLDEDDFAKLYAEYIPDKKKCKLTYRVHGYDKETIYFDSIDEKDDGSAVTCKESKVYPTDGIDLPVEAYGFDAVWKKKNGDEITDFKKTKFKWSTDKKAYIYLEREDKDDSHDDPMDEDDFKRLYAEYIPKDDTCKLTYKVHGETKETIYFKKIDESSDGTSVTCKKNYVTPTDGIDLPVYADDFDAVWKKRNGDEVTEFKETKWKWEKDKESTLYLKREKDDSPDEPMDEDDFKRLYAEYIPDKKKCKLTYRVHGEDKETIYFDDIDESGDGTSVTCKKDRVRPTEGIDLPVYADDFDAVWKKKNGDEVTEFKETKWKWEKDKESTLYLRRKKDDTPKDPMDEDDFKRLVARYKSKEKRCSITYKVHGEDKETIYLNKMEESDNGRKVVCQGNEEPTDGVWLPVKADGFDAIWKEKGGSTVEVEKSMLRWDKDEDIKLTLVREPDGMDEDDFDKLRVIYDAKREKCKLIYKVDGERKEEVWLNDRIKENKDGDKVVCKEYDVKPTDGIHLPVKANDVDAKWFDEKGVSQDVENAKVTWDDGKDIKATIYLDH